MFNKFKALAKQHLNAAVKVSVLLRWPASKCCPTPAVTDTCCPVSPASQDGKTEEKAEAEQSDAVRYLQTLKDYALLME